MSVGRPSIMVWKSEPPTLGLLALIDELEEFSIEFGHVLLEVGIFLPPKNRVTMEMAEPSHA